MPVRLNIPTEVIWGPILDNYHLSNSLQHYWSDSYVEEYTNSSKQYELLWLAADLVYETE